jgi:hypothetical protein
MLPALRIVKTPVEGTRAVPGGTPVLVASGYPHADGCGRQPLVTGLGAGMGGGVVGEVVAPELALG